MDFVQRRRGGGRSRRLLVIARWCVVTVSFVASLAVAGFWTGAIQCRVILFSESEESREMVTDTLYRRDREEAVTVHVRRIVPFARGLAYFEHREARFVNPPPLPPLTALQSTYSDADYLLGLREAINNPIDGPKTREGLSVSEAAELPLMMRVREIRFTKDVDRPSMLPGIVLQNNDAKPSQHLAIYLPYWMLILAASAPGLFVSRHAVRRIAARRHGGVRCRVCGYLLEGLRAGMPCPECGTTP